MTLKRTDELNSLANHAGQVVEELKRMRDEDFRYVEKFVLELKILARDFKPAPPDRGYVLQNPHAPVDNPREELEAFASKLRFTIADLDRAKLLLDERRAAIEDLLK